MNSSIQPLVAALASLVYFLKTIRMYCEKGITLKLAEVSPGSIAVPQPIKEFDYIQSGLHAAYQYIKRTDPKEGDFIKGFLTYYEKKEGLRMVWAALGRCQAILSAADAGLVEQCKAAPRQAWTNLSDNNFQAIEDLAARLRLLVGLEDELEVDAERPPPGTDKLLTTVEAAKVLHLHPGRVSALCLSGAIPSTKVGGDYHLRQGDVENHMRQNPRSPTKAKPRLPANRQPDKPATAKPWYCVECDGDDVLSPVKPTFSCPHCGHSRWVVRGLPKTTG